MQAMAQNRITFTTLFGAYVMRSCMEHTGKMDEKNEQERKKRQQELFETVDDYIEQA